MQERLHYWTTYIGSAALAAFLATCLNAPTVATYTCEDVAATDTQRCQLADTIVAVPGGPVDVDETMARTVASLN